jgi:hypothetical protein
VTDDAVAERDGGKAAARVGKVDESGSIWGNGSECVNASGLRARGAE